MSAFLLSESVWLTFKTPLKTNRVHDNIRGVKLTPGLPSALQNWASHRRVKCDILKLE